MRRLLCTTALAGALAVVIATAGPAGAAPTGPLAPGDPAAPTAPAVAGTLPVTPSSIAWQTCADPDLTSFGAVCGSLVVPLDYSKPSGAKVTLALSMVRHSVPDNQYQGIMLVNPGGPGGSGVGLSFLGQLIPGGAGNAYDWIGWDPRGVGASTPSLSCDPDYFAGPRPEFNPRTQELRKFWIATTKAYATACGQDGGALLDHVTTVDSAKDMDAIRRAMGQPKLNFYGFSYGTYLGSVYSTLYPAQSRRLVFDSTVDPTGVWYRDNLDQDVAFEANMRTWFRWVAKYDSVYHLGTTGVEVQKLWYDTKAELYAHPAGGVVGGSEWNDIFLYAGYYQQTWLDLGAQFASWVHDKDTAALVASYESTEGIGDDNGYAMYLAVQCSDVAWPTDLTKWYSDNFRVAQVAPFETWGNAMYNLPCAFWPGKTHTPVSVDGSKVASVLMIDETLDAATPYAGSLKVRSLYPGASLIALPGGTSHANSLFGLDCLDDQIAAYLRDGTLPTRKAGNQADATCAPLPVPDPTAVTAETFAKSTATSPAVLRERLRAAVGRA